MATKKIRTNGNSKQNPALTKLLIEQRIKQAMQEAKQSAIEYTVTIYSLLMIMVLSDKTDLPDDEIQRIINEMGRLSDSIDKEYMTIPDAIKAIKEEHNYKIDEARLLKFYPELEGYLRNEPDSIGTGV